MSTKTLRRIAAGFMIVAGAALMWLSPEVLGGAFVMAAGLALEALGIALEHKGDDR